MPEVYLPTGGWSPWLTAVIVTVLLAVITTSPMPSLLPLSLLRSVGNKARGRGPMAVGLSAAEKQHSSQRARENQRAP